MEISSKALVILLTLPVITITVFLVMVRSMVSATKEVLDSMDSDGIAKFRSLKPGQKRFMYLMQWTVATLFYIAAIAGEEFGNQLFNTESSLMLSIWWLVALLQIASFTFVYRKLNRNC